MAPNEVVQQLDKQLALPIQVSTPVDVGKLLNEIKNVDELLLQLQLREPGKQQVSLPKTSQALNQLAEFNKLNLLQDQDRKSLRDFLQSIKDNAPVIHASFSAEPSIDFLEKFIAWLRREIDPLVIVTIGLQPAIGVGCVLRTTNKQFNFSLKENFKQKRELLREQIALKEPKT